MIEITRRNLLTATMSAGLLLAAPAVAAAARPKNITVASLLGEDKPETKVWVWIRKFVEEKLPGEFRFNIVKNSALGGEKEVLEGARLGSIHASLSTVSSLSAWLPELQVLDLPFLFRDASHVRRTVDGEVGADLKRKLALQNFIIGDFINYGARHLLTKEPVTKPQQLNGKKIRVIQSPLHTKLWSAFGTTPVGIPIPETYNALASGVADAMDLTKSAYAGFKLYEVVPYMTETGHIWASGVIFYAAGFWEQLTEEQKVVFQEASRQGAEYFNDLIVSDEMKSMEQAMKNGGKIVVPEALDEWQKGAQGVWRDIADTVGGMSRITSIHEFS